MDCHGRMLAHVLLHESDGILSMSWNYPSFLVEDSSESDTDSDDYSPPQGSVVRTSFCFSFASVHEDISNTRELSCSTKTAGWLQFQAGRGREMVPSCGGGMGVGAESWYGGVDLSPALPPASLCGLLQVVPHLCCSAPVCTNEVTAQSSKFLVRVSEKHLERGVSGFSDKQM